MWQNRAPPCTSHASAVSLWNDHYQLVLHVRAGHASLHAQSSTTAGWRVLNNVTTRWYLSAKIPFAIIAVERNYFLNKKQNNIQFFYSFLFLLDGFLGFIGPCTSRRQPIWIFVMLYSVEENTYGNSRKIILILSVSETNLTVACLLASLFI